MNDEKLKLLEIFRKRNNESDRANIIPILNENISEYFPNVKQIEITNEHYSFLADRLEFEENDVVSSLYYRGYPLDILEERREMIDKRHRAEINFRHWSRFNDRDLQEITGKSVREILTGEFADDTAFRIFSKIKGGGFSAAGDWGENNRDGVPTIILDHSISFLVQSLVKAGIYTVMSCDGHGEIAPKIFFKDRRNTMMFVEILNDMDISKDSRFLSGWIEFGSNSAWISWRWIIQENPLRTDPEEWVKFIADAIDLGEKINSRKSRY